MRFIAIFLFLLAVGLVSACRSSPTTAPTAKYLALGDSYTSGERVEPQDRWPVQLAHRLKDAGIDLGEPQIIAVTGWTTADLAAGMDEAKPVGPYRLVTLLIGVNNEYRGQDSGQYRQQFHDLLQRAVALAGGNAKHVVVLSIPDWGVTPFAQRFPRPNIGAEIDQFNAINRDETAKASAAYVDVTPESRTATTQPALIAGDGLHPSPKMYSQWVDLALPVVRNAMADRP